jgi:hypothetical protein
VPEPPELASGGEDYLAGSLALAYIEDLHAGHDSDRGVGLAPPDASELDVAARALRRSGGSRSGQPMAGASRGDCTSSSPHHAGHYSLPDARKRLENMQS